MRRRVSLAAVAGLVLGVQAHAAEGLPEPRASFTADTVVQVGGERVNLKTFHSAGLERQEMEVDGLSQITILRPDLDRAFIIQQGIDDYLELPIDEVTVAPSPHALEGYQVEALGAAREGGEAVTKYRLSRDGEGDNEDAHFTAWLTDDGIVMRLEGKIDFEGRPEKVLLIRRNLRRGPQDPALFQPDRAVAALAGDGVEEPPDSPAAGAGAAD